MAPPQRSSAGGLFLRGDVLVAIQFPFADARSFIPSETHRVPTPLWPLPRPFKDFVRGFGALVPRRRGGIENWPGEETFCKVTRAVRFDGAALESLGHELEESSLQPHCAFRRFLSDGGAVCRFEVGIGYRRRSPRRFRPLRSRECLSLLESTLRIPVLVNSPRQQPVLVELWSCAEVLARHYLLATTRLTLGKPQETRAWWFTPGTPIVVVEYHESQVAALPPYSRAVNMGQETSFHLHHYRIEYRGTRFGVWFLGWGARSDRDDLRKLRLHLLRLHAERECLKETLRSIAQGKIEVPRAEEASDRLQQYLRDSVRLLKREKRFGLPQSRILEAAQDFEDLVSPGERDTLLTQLARARVNILRSVKALASHEAAPVSGHFHIVGSGNTILVGSEQRIGSQIMTTYDIKIGDHATVHGDLVVAETIQNSFNKLRDSAASPELKDALTELTRNVAEMAKHLPQESAREAARDLEILTKEATSGAPRRRWWELSVEGLKDAAKTVGEIAAPVLASVEKVIRFLT